MTHDHLGVKSGGLSSHARRHGQQPLRVMASWGFEYKSNLVWAKRRKDGGPDGRGVGFYFRNVTELILFGVRGRMRTLPPGRRQPRPPQRRRPPKSPLAPA